MNNLPQRLTQGLTMLEATAWNKLANSDWYRCLSNRVRDCVHEYPPFFMYQIKDSEQFCTITQYCEKKSDAEQPVMLEVLVERKYNRDMLPTHPERLILIMPVALEKVMLRAIVDAEGIINERARLTEIANYNLANRDQALNRTRRVEAEHRLDKLQHILKKGK